MLFVHVQARRRFDRPASDLQMEGINLIQIEIIHVDDFPGVPRTFLYTLFFFCRWDQKGTYLILTKLKGHNLNIGVTHVSVISSQNLSLLLIFGPKCSYVNNSNFILYQTFDFYNLYEIILGRNLKIFCQPNYTYFVRG